MLRVNSFPRTGNIFTSSFLNKFFDKNKVDAFPEVMHDIKLLDSRDVDQIVIIRNPMDAIVSSEILRSTNYPFDGLDISFEIKRWIEWHEVVLKNSDHLFLFSFEDITNKPVECLTNLGDMLNIFYGDKESLFEYHKENTEKERSNNRDNIFASSASSNKYNETVKKYLSQEKDVIEKINDLYQKLCSII